MHTPIITEYDEATWSRWGLSFVASYFELAKGNNLCIVDKGLSQHTKNFLIEHNVTLLAKEDINASLVVSPYTVFQDSIEVILNNIKDKLLYRPQGSMWAINANFVKLLTGFISSCRDLQLINYIDYFAKAYPHMVEEMPSYWNYKVDDGLYWDDGYKINGKKVVSIFFPEETHNLPIEKFTFGKSHPSDFLRWQNRYKNNARIKPVFVK